jgi:hypothetical protein
MPANSSETTSDRRSNRFLEFFRMPGAAAVALGTVGIPLILLAGDDGFQVALWALCLYPILDVPRILGCSSWWRGAILSFTGWFSLFVALPATVSVVRPLDAGSLVFLLPFMMYPAALAISGLVRLEGRISGRALESGPRIAAILITIAFGVFFGVPMMRDYIAGVREKNTGNTPPNTFYSADGEVLSATPEQVSVRLDSGSTQSFRFGPETKFGFSGPFWRSNRTPPGPDWLEPGLRVDLQYANRNHEAWAAHVSMRIERKGCAGDPTWAATSQTSVAPSPEIPSLTGTRWETWLGPPNPSVNIFEFLEGNALGYLDSDKARQTDARWRQNGPVVNIEMWDCYALYEGRIEGDLIKGEYWDERGGRESWTARRTENAASASTPK